MKKLLIAAAVTLVCVGAFAQGKLAFDINSDNVIYLTTDINHVYPADATRTADTGYGNGSLVLPGQSLYTGLGSGGTAGAAASLAGAPTFVVALYGGASAGSMTLQTTTTLADVSNPGGIVAVSLTLAGLAAGTPAFFQEEVYDSQATDAVYAWSHGMYAGESAVFQATPSAAVYAAIYGSAASSTLQPGTFVPTDLVGLGFNGGIPVYANIPEPGTFALAGLGLAALLVFRRRS